MSQHDLQKVIDDFYSQLNLDPVETGERFQVGIWLPIEYKPTYDNIQKTTKKAFTKLLRGLVIQALQKIKINDEAA